MEAPLLSCLEAEFAALPQMLLQVAVKRWPPLSPKYSFFWEAAFSAGKKCFYESVPLVVQFVTYLEPRWNSQEDTPVDQIAILHSSFIFLYISCQHLAFDMPVSSPHLC